jgi:flagellar biosynthetic protein FliQ
MESLSISDAMSNGMLVIVMASMPILLVAMGVGLIVGILQTATSIQEQTLAFIPKIIAVIVSMMIFSPWISGIVRDFTIGLFSNLHRYVG